MKSSVCAMTLAAFLALAAPGFSSESGAPADPALVRTAVRSIHLETMPQDAALRHGRLELDGLRPGQLDALVRDLRETFQPATNLSSNPYVLPASAWPAPAWSGAWTGASHPWTALPGTHGW